MRNSNPPHHLSLLLEVGTVVLPDQHPQKYLPAPLSFLFGWTVERLGSSDGRDCCSYGGSTGEEYCEYTLERSAVGWWRDKGKEGK
jgi:hypothetical protein